MSTRPTLIWPPRWVPPVLPESPCSSHTEIISLPLTCQYFLPSETPSAVTASFPSLASHLPFLWVSAPVSCYHRSFLAHPPPKNKVKRGNPILPLQRIRSSHSPVKLCNPTWLCSFKVCPSNKPDTPWRWDPAQHHRLFLSKACWLKTRTPEGSHL